MNDGDFKKGAGQKQQISTDLKKELHQLMQVFAVNLHLTDTRFDLEEVCYSSFY